MSQVSRRLLDKRIEEQIFETLWEAISQLKDKKDIQIFLNDLLTPVERIVLAKRLAIAVLLLKSTDYGTIKNLLKVSGETISKVSLILKMNNGYKLAINKIVMTEAGRQFWQDIESALYRLGTPRKAFLPEEVIKYRLGHKKKTLV
ncbi:MAG: Trp family transcriptional regulator [Candidatus Curtissbacteria bacterium]|nr:Trp family transcriptional regulator [Candidatus Curtissbacteria bacterium]